MTRIALMLDVVGDRRGSAGNVRLLLELMSGLCNCGHEVSLVCHDYDPEGNFEQFGRDFDVRAVRTGSYPRATGKRAILERYRNGMKRMAELVPADAELINAHDWPALRAGRLAAQRLDVPLIWTRNDDTLWERALIPDRTARGTTSRLARIASGTFGLLDRRDARRAAQIVVLSEFDAEMVRVAYGRPAHVIRIGCAERFYEPADRSAARTRLGVGGDEFLIVALALLVPHRRFEDLIAAVALLGDDDTHARCLIVGSDHLDREYADLLESQITELGVAGRVELHRHAISDQELRELYAAADVYVFPSSRQSYGQAPLEALAAGTPVIVSSGAGVHEVLAGKPGVEVVEPDRPADIATAIRSSMGAPRGGAEATRAWTRDRLSNERYAQEMAALIARARADRARNDGAVADWGDEGR